LYTLEHSYATNIFESVEAGDYNFFAGDFTTQSTYNAFDSTKQAIRVYFYTVYLAQNATHDSSWFDLMGLLEWLRWPGGKCGSMGGMAAMMGATVPPNVSQIAGVTPILILKGLVTLIDPRWCKWPWTLPGWIMKAIKEMGLDFNWLPPYSDSTAEDKVCPPGVEFEEEEKAIEAVPIIGNTGFEAPPSYDGHGGMFSYYWAGHAAVAPAKDVPRYINRNWRYLRWLHLPQELQERWWEFEKQRLLGFPEPPPHYNEWLGKIDYETAWNASHVNNSNGWQAKTEVGQMNFWAKYMVHRVALMSTQYYSGGSDASPPIFSALPYCKLEEVPGSVDSSNSGIWDTRYYLGGHPAGIGSGHPCHDKKGKMPTWEDIINWEGWRIRFQVGLKDATGPGFEQVRNWLGHTLLPKQYMYNRHYGFFKHKNFGESWRLTMGGRDIAEYIWYAWALGGPRQLGHPQNLQSGMPGWENSANIGKVFPKDRTKSGHMDPIFEGPDREKNWRLKMPSGLNGPGGTAGYYPEGYGDADQFGFGLPLYWTANWGMAAGPKENWDKMPDKWAAYAENHNQLAEDWYTLF